MEEHNENLQKSLQKNTQKWFENQFLQTYICSRKNNICWAHSILKKTIKAHRC